MEDNILIERISENISINYNDAQNLLNYLFKKIIIEISYGKCFHLENIGYFYTNTEDETYIEKENNRFYIPPKTYINFISNSADFESSIDTIFDKNKDVSLKNEEKIKYTIIIKTIKELLDKNIDVYIENFGTFLANDKIYLTIEFTADKYLSIFLNPYFNLNEFKLNEDSNFEKEQINTHDITEEIEDSQDEYKNSNNTFEDELEIEEIIEDSNEDIIETDYKITEEKDIPYYDDLKTDEEYEDENTFKKFKKYENNNYVKSNINETLEKIKEEILERENYNRLNKPIKVNILPLNKEKPYNRKIEADVLENVTHNKKNSKKSIKKHDNKNRAFFSIFIKIAITIMLIFSVSYIIGFMFKRIKEPYKTAAKTNENESIYSIVNNYFKTEKSTELSYITPKNMYYWDISRALYGNPSYWPLIYSLNASQYSINNYIKRGSKIVYKNIPEKALYDSKSKERKNLYSALSRIYIALYPLLVEENKPKHALWALKLSAYYDLKSFEERKDKIPEHVYQEIVKGAK